MTAKANCWTFMKCGHGPDAMAAEQCPAVTASCFDGAHEGQNGGRACWSIAGTMCGQDCTGKFARDLDDCAKCGFYSTVQQEEGPAFLSIAELLSIQM